MTDNYTRRYRLYLATTDTPTNIGFMEWVRHRIAAYCTEQDIGRDGSRFMKDNMSHVFDDWIEKQQEERHD